MGNYFRDHDLWQLQETRIMHDSFETSRNGGVNELFRQEPDGTFTEVAREAGVDSTGWTLATGAGDLDGDLDLVATNGFVSAGPEEYWPVTYTWRRGGGNSFAGQSDPRIHFGLGESETVERLEVRWPDGGVQVLEDVAADRHLTIRQDPKNYASPARADSSSSISTRRSSSSVR